MDSKKILIISQEIFPYLPESETSMSARLLPQYLQENGHEVRIFMPRFGVINERRNQLHEVIRLTGINMIIDDNDHPLIIKVASIQPARLQVYFIDNDDFFKRKTLFDIKAKQENDNDERAIFFARGPLEAIKKLRWIPDIIHCHGWFSALSTVYLKKMYHDDPFLNRAKIIYTAYNDNKEAKVPEKLFERMAFDKIMEDDLKMMEGKTDHLAFSKLACHYADAIIKGSEKLAPELEAFIANMEGKPVLGYQGVEGFEAKNENFYDQLLANSK